MARKSNAAKVAQVEVEEIESAESQLSAMFDGSELINDVETVATNEDGTEVVVETVEGKKDDKGRFVAVNMSMEQLELLGIKNKSQAIRHLVSENYSPSAIAKFLNIRYQHVRNVMMQPLKRPVVEAAQAVVEVEEPVVEG